MVPVVTVAVEVPPPEIEVGLNVIVLPIGSPVALRLTTPLKPFTAVVVTV